jgi:hypothetical protein
MIIEANGSGGGFREKITDISDEVLDAFSAFEISEEKIKSMLDNLDISADVKAALYSISKATIRIGGKIIRIGRKIIDFVGLVMQEFTNASFGLIFGAIVGFLMASIPIVGFVLGPLIGPIAMAFGLVVGLYQDVQDKAMKRRIEEVNAKFSSLAGRQL